MKATRMKAPEPTPAAPKPAMERPMIKAVLVGATAERSSQHTVAPLSLKGIHTTDETSQFENENCRQVCPLQGEILEEFAPG
jgi:hypothetical protein